MGLGDLYRWTKKYDDSETMFRKAIELNPRSEAFLGMGWLYLEQEKFADAERAFMDFNDLIRPKGEAYYGLGHVYLRENRFSEAESAFRKALELNPGNKMFEESLKKAVQEEG